VSSDNSGSAGGLRARLGNLTPTSAAEVMPAPDDETVLERRIKALSLRNGGSTYTQIAEALGISATQARKDVAAGLREVVAASREDLIAEHRSVLLDLRRASYRVAMSGDVDSGKLVLSTLEREAKMFGLDAPTAVAIGVNEVEFAERMAALFEVWDTEVPRELARLVPAATRRELEQVIDAELDEPATDDTDKPTESVASQDDSSASDELETPESVGVQDDSSTEDVVSQDDPAPRWSNI